MVGLEIMIEEKLLAGEGIIRTSSGIYINVFNPNPDHIIIEDIAHALSFLPRFGGHLPHFYSVAQHSIWCMELANKIDPIHSLAALLHDASEAYLLDIPTPIKSRLPEYKIAEDNLMKIISNKFGFVYPLHTAVKFIDKEALKHEWDTYMIKKETPVFLSHDEIKKHFISHFHNLKSLEYIKIHF